MRFAPGLLAVLACWLVASGAPARASGGIDVLHAFAGHDGAWSRGTMLRDGTTLYGRTAIGGKADAGTVFRIDQDGSGFASLYSFSAGGDNRLGNQPHHNAMLLLGDRLLGAALYGGNEKGDDPKRVTGDFTSGAPPTQQLGNGTIFTLTREGHEYAVLLELDGRPDPALPHSPPVIAPDGRTLYGMTSSGGEADSGTLYTIQTDGTGFRILHSFVSKSGHQPHGQVAFDRDGNLLGMTRKGGTPASGTGAGVVFRFDLASSRYQVLHTFVAGARDDGDTNDHGYLTLVDGVAYGTTELGGAHAAGTLFAIAEDGSDFAILHSFGSGASDGKRPYGSLLPLGGWLYGTTTRGGTGGDGTLFRFRPADRAYQVLASFDRRTSGAFPEDSLVASADGRFVYGLTQAGGVHDPNAERYFGTLFRVAVPAID